MFALTKKENPLDQTILESCCGGRVTMGRPKYLPVIEREADEFLRHTQIDRHKWRQAQPAGDTMELVCTSFSLLMWALFEQERLRSGCLYPLAIARVGIWNAEKKGHSLLGIVTPDWDFKLIEPQNDQIFAPPADWEIREVVFQ